MKDNVHRIELNTHKVPEFKEEKSKDWVIFGTTSPWINNYPAYLLDLYNRSAKHNAIINGKVDYVTGGGFTFDADDMDMTKAAKIQKFIDNPNPNESLNDIFDKVALDLEIYNGVIFEVIYNKVKKNIASIYVADLNKYRRGKDGGWWYSPEGWKKSKPNDIEFIPDFDISKPSGKQMLYFGEYNPASDLYPIPSYIGCIPYIEVDVEIANFHLNSIKRGFSGGQIITFFDGVPDEDQKEAIEQKLYDKHAGTDNANSMVLVFANGRESGGVDIQSLTGNDFDKRFDSLNAQVQQELFSGHRVTDPNLFGIKQDGIFATRNQLVDSFELFKNTYIKGRQNFLLRIFNGLLKVQDLPEVLTIINTEPISAQFSEATLVSVMTTDEIREKAGLTKQESANTTDSKELDAQAALKGSVGGVTGLITLLQNVKTGIIDPSSAISVLTELYGFTPEKAAATVLGTEASVNAAMRKVLMDADNELKLVDGFSKCGLSLDEYEVVNSRGFHFESDADAEARENELRKYGFVDTAFEMGVLDILRKEPTTTYAEIATQLNVSMDRIVEAVRSLQASRYIEIAIENVADSSQRVATITSQGERALEETTPLEASFKIAYRYVLSGQASGAEIIDTTRDFCREMVNLSKSRVWTLAEIQQIGMRENRNVWLRKGGFWTRKGSNITTPYCRHQWEQITVKAK
jgi:DNA-binding MarR family transcriptional regulator